MIKWQKVCYDFSYHQQEFNTNIKILTLSEAKSLLPVRTKHLFVFIINKFLSQLC
jgi:hypothetical protein